MLGSLASQFARLKTKNLVSDWLHGLMQGYRTQIFADKRGLKNKEKKSGKSALICVA